MNLSAISPAILAVLSLASAVPATAAPSTRIGAELYIPLETASARFVLADAATGEIRICSVAPDGTVSGFGSYPTFLSDLSGAESGFVHNGTEHLVLTNTTSNRITLSPLGGDTPIPLGTETPGPAFAALIRENSGHGMALAAACRYHRNGFVLELLEGAPTAPETVDTETILTDYTAVASLRSIVAGRRFVAVAGSQGDVPLLGVFRRQSTGLAAPSALVSRSGDRLATEVTGADGRMLVLGYSEGSDKLEFHTIQPMTGELVETHIDTAPFLLGAVFAVNGVPGLNRGVALVAADGASSAVAEVVSGSSLQNITIMPALPGSVVTGLLPVPGVGLVRVSRPAGSAGAALDYQTLVWDGGSWVVSKSGALPGFPGIDPGSDFATLFWYAGNPLTAPGARMVGMETRGAWTRSDSPVGAIPAVVIGESYVNPETGLGNAAPFLASTPEGADHLLTNQVTPSVSLTALAGRAVLLEPGLDVSPASGTYGETIFVSARFPFDSHDAWFREDRSGATWRKYDGGFPLSDSARYLFHLQPKSGGVPGAIVSRDYNFPAPTDWGPDSDGDGVPDFVERRLGLNPLSGADADGDGRSDLEEMLDGTDPADPASFKPRDVAGDAGPDGTRGSTGHGSGFTILARTLDDRGDGLAAGQEMQLRGSSGVLLATGPAAPLSEPAELAGEIASRLHPDAPVDERDWVLLQSPLFFTTGTAAVPPRTGVESYRVLAVPVQPQPEVPLPPGGVSGDLDTRVAQWMFAVSAAYANWQPVSAVTETEVWHNAGAVAAEALVHSALLQLPAAQASALGVPEDLADFTLLGARDSILTAYSDPMRRALLAAGFDFRISAENLESALTAPAAADLRVFCGVLHEHHRLRHAANPTMGFPLDALRALRDQGSLPATYASAATPAEAAAARSRLYALISNSAAWRPVDTWTVVVQPPAAGSPAPFAFLKTDTMAEVRFIDSLGVPFHFAQGLGLKTGSTVTVSGYTDVFPATPPQVMEVIAVHAVSVPVTSATDGDGNLLDDDWEKFFFGHTGVDAQDGPAGSPYSYLHYFLAGADPRSPSSLSGAPLDFSPPMLVITTVDGNPDAVEWNWPAEYAGRFRFVLEESQDLMGFTPLELGEPLVVGPQRLRFNLPPAQTAPRRNFFRLGYSLR